VDKLTRYARLAKI